MIRRDSRGFRLSAPRWRIVVGAVLAATLPIGAAAQEEAPTAPPALTLEEAVNRALAQNPDYLSQQNERTSAQWGIRAAQGNFLPSADASTSLGYTAPGERRVGDLAFGEQPANYSSSYRLSMSYSLSGAQILQPSLARAQARAVDQRIEGAGASLVAEVTQRYLAALQAQEREAQAAREVARTAEHVRLAEARLEVGAGTQLDVRRAEVEQGRAEVQQIQARQTRTTELLALGRLMGQPLSPEVRLASEFGLFAPEWDRDQLVQLAVDANPTIRAVRAQADAADTRVQVARSNFLPTLSFSAGLAGSVYQAGNIDPLVSQQLSSAQNSYESCLRDNQIRQLLDQAPRNCATFDPANPAVEAEIRERVRAQNSGWPFDYNRQPVSASMSVSIPIFTGFARRQQVEEARVAASNAQHAVRAEELRLHAEVGTALGALETAHQTARLQQRVRETAAEELRLAQERFRFGAASSLEVVDAQARLAEAEVGEIEAVYQFHRSLANLEALVGRPLR